VTVQTPRGRKTYQVLSVVTLHDQPDALGDKRA
jgi:hypothetical protein